MNNDLLKELRVKYNDQTIQRDNSEKKLQTLLKRKEILENSPLIKDYIELLEQIDASIEESYKEKFLLDSIISDFKYSKNDETNKIYQYVDTFITEDGLNVVVGRDCDDAEFDRYVDIESLSIIDNPVEDRYSFEASNKIIVGGYLPEIHNDFILNCIKDGQDVAVEKVLTRYKKNR